MFGKRVPLIFFGFLLLSSLTMIGSLWAQSGIVFDRDPGAAAVLGGAGSNTVCDCPPGYYCDFYAEDPGHFFCVPNPPPIIYVDAGEFCGFGEDEQGRRVEFRCMLDAECRNQICVCREFPGGPCGPIYCPEGTFCEVDSKGTYSCGRFEPECVMP